MSAAGLGVWFLLEAHRLHLRVARIAAAGDGSQPAAAAVRAGPAAGSAAGGAAAGHGPTVAEGACAGVVQPSANPAPMRAPPACLSIAYLTLLFAVIAVTSLLPWGGW